MKNSNLLLLLITFAITSFISCKKSDDNTKTYQPGTVTLEFENIAGTTHVDITGGTFYTNAAGESFNITKLKYYISNVELLKSDGTYYKVPESYYLINEVDTNAHVAKLANIPGGVYIGVRYMVGVDSMRNVSGAQTGVLAISNGMYWSSSDGYIFLNLEGTSLAAVSGTNTNGKYLYQIGGYKKSTGANMRTITVTFGENFIVDGAREAEVHTDVNILELFKNPVNISLAVDNNITSPGIPASIIANNYVDMFQYAHIHNDQ